MWLRTVCGIIWVGMPEGRNEVELVFITFVILLSNKRLCRSISLHLSKAIDHRDAKRTFKLKLFRRFVESIFVGEGQVVVHRLFLFLQVRMVGLLIQHQLSPGANSVAFRYGSIHLI